MIGVRPDGRSPAPRPPSIYANRDWRGSRTTAGPDWPPERAERLLLEEGDSAGTNKASQAFWKVRDLEKEVEQLRAKGVKFEEYDADEIGGLVMKDGIASGGGMKAAWFKDSEGNIMALIEDGKA